MKRPKILIADDEAVVRDTLREILSEAGYEPVLAADGRETLQKLSEEIQVALLDLDMPGPGGLECLRHATRHQPEIETIVVTGSSRVRHAVEAMKNGASDYLTKPVNMDELLEVVRRAVEQNRIKAENRQLRSALSTPPLKPEFIGESRVAQQVLDRVRRVAGLDSTALITGESGAGKGLLARLIHLSSRRQQGPFITVSCTALPRELVEAELFGHEKGSFTGAHERRPGRVEMAKGGTLFLDEVGDMPIDLQPKLLNFLQDHTFVRIGSQREISVDVRVIAATHQDLPALCREKRFREDLFYRLNVLPIRCPPLRERPKDIPPLIDHLLGRIAQSRGQAPVRPAPEAVRLMTAYPWPGNVRELENVLERSTAFMEGTELGPGDLPAEVVFSGARAAPGPRSLAGMTLAEIEKAALLQTLELTGGNKARAARHLGISEKSIYNKMKRLGLS